MSKSNLCRSGRHLLTPDNIYSRPGTQERECRACARERKRAGGDKGAFPKRCARIGCYNAFFQEVHNKGRHKYCCNACGNADRMYRRGLRKTPLGPGRSLSKLRCRKGHIRTEENTSILSNGQTRCLDCQKEANRRYKATERGRRVSEEADRRYRATPRGRLKKKLARIKWEQRNTIAT